MIFIITANLSYATQFNKYSNNTNQNVVIGKVGEFLGHNRIPNDKIYGLSKLPLGSNIAPLVAKSYYDISGKSDACIQNAGAVRTSLKAGDITTKTVYELLPFDNTLFELKMKGSEIKQVLEDAISNYADNNGSTGSFPYSYGLKYDISINNTIDNRISNLEIKDKITGTWSIIDTNKFYIIVANSYIAFGNDGYNTFLTIQKNQTKSMDTHINNRISFIKYLKTKKRNNKSIMQLPSKDHCVKSYKQ